MLNHLVCLSEVVDQGLQYGTQAAPSQKQLACRWYVEMSLAELSEVWKYLPENPSVSLESV